MNVFVHNVWGKNPILLMLLAQYVCGLLFLAQNGTEHTPRKKQLSCLVGKQTRGSKLTSYFHTYAEKYPYLSKPTTIMFLYFPFME
jgi:hypothetical protein